MRSFARSAMLMAALVLTSPSASFGWGFPGHETVGAIADIILKRDNPELYERIQDILGGKTLREVATYPDCLFVPCPTAPNFTDYAIRNPRHDKYHYTDVPFQRKRYVALSGGTHRDDVVQILRYAAGRLRGSAPADVPANLEPKEAIWIIAHMVGDIHQPLHVWAMYFDRKCDADADPNDFPNLPNFGIGLEVAETHGGGWFQFPVDRQLHRFWDREAVSRAMQKADVFDGSVEKFALILADKPKPPKTLGHVAGWSRRWADEIRPLSLAAHQRLTIQRPGNDIKDSHKEVECRWQVQLGDGYEEWATEKAIEQLTKAGHRLAAMLLEAMDEN